MICHSEHDGENDSCIVKLFDETFSALKDLRIYKKKNHREKVSCKVGVWLIYHELLHVVVRGRIILSLSKIGGLR